LFYSQHPNGALDDKSFHGGCPVLHGTKYAANLWVWNAPQAGHADAPYQDVQVTFSCVSHEKVDLYAINIDQNRFEGTEREHVFVYTLSITEPPKTITTKKGNILLAKLGATGEIVKEWTIGSEKQYDFVI
jgi:hypothetical protein